MPGQETNGDNVGMSFPLSLNKNGNLSVLIRIILMRQF